MGILGAISVVKATQTPKKVTILPEIHRQLEELAEGQGKTVYRMINEVLWRVLNPDRPNIPDEQIWGKEEQEGK
jgi:hypothetical protein